MPSTGEATVREALGQVAFRSLSAEALAMSAGNVSVGAWHRR
jgi:hypothetical protein